MKVTPTTPRIVVPCAVVSFDFVKFIKAMRQNIYYINVAIYNTNGRHENRATVRFSSWKRRNELPSTLRVGWIQASTSSSWRYWRTQRFWWDNEMLRSTTSASTVAIPEVTKYGD